MKDKTKNYLITISFISILLITLLANIIKQDQEISITERRKLAQAPEITLKTLTNGEVADKLEKYTTDQFVLRDALRGLKSLFSIHILNMQDNNKLFEKEDAIYKIEYPLKEENVNKSVDKIKEVYEKYLTGKRAYYAIIPDKNYYLENDSHLKMDYDKLKKIAKSKLVDLEYIDIWQDLELNDYYRTDLHWRQENLGKVVNKIQTSMGQDVTALHDLKKVDMGDFYGTYYGQLGIKVSPDKIYVVTNDIIENCKTYNWESKKEGTVYDTSSSNDKYDIYLSGATPIITIENSSSKTKRELLIFRDSFGSSIAPLLVQNYSKITLIDLRYISSKILDRYVEFNNQDVLFLYSTLVLNQNAFK